MISYTDTPLFAAPVDVPDIRTAPPVAPGSRSSEMASALLGPFRRASWRKVMLALAAAGRPLTREELSERTGMKDCALCGRISELRPIWIEAHSCSGVSAAGVKVDTYSLTAAGLARVRASVKEER